METNILQKLNQKKNLLFRLISCVLFVLLLIYVFKVIPYKHDYKVTITMKGKNPGTTRLYYSKKYFTDDHSAVSDATFPERTFVFKYPEKVRTFRLDFDELHKQETQFIISSIRVNNMLFSGKEAYAILSLKNQCSVELNGNDLIVTVKAENAADDVYLCFSPLRRYAKADFFGYSYIFFYAVFLLLAVGGCILVWSYCLTWLKVCYSVITWIKTFFSTVIIRSFQVLAQQVRKLWFDHANIILIIAFISLSAVIFFCSPNFFVVRMTFADADPGPIKLYYALQSFDENKSQVNDNKSGIKTFLFADWEPVRFLRFDFERPVPDGTVFTLESVQINNMKLSKADIIKRTAAANQAKISTETGKYQILARSYGKDGKILPAADDAFFILDYPKSAYSENFLGSWRWVFKGIYAALVLALAIWIGFVPTEKINRFFAELYFLSASAARLIFHFIIRFYKEILQIRKLWDNHANIILIIALISLSAVIFFFSPNFYMVRITFADSDPGPIKLYYALQSFNENKSQVNDNKSGIKTFLFADWEPVRFLRFDFDRPLPDGTVFTLESVQINNMKLSKADIIKRTAAANQAKIITERGKYQILARSYGKDGKILPAADDAFFILDYPKSAYSENFLGSWRWVFKGIYAALVLALAIWIGFVPTEKINRFFAGLYFLSASAVRLFFRFIIRFYKEILLLSTISLFVFLRIIVLKVPPSRISFFVYEDAQCGLLIGVLAVAAILIHRKIFSLFSFLLLLGMYLIWFVDIYLKIDLNARFNFKETGTWVAHANSMIPIVKKAVTQSYFIWEMLLVLTTAAVFVIISREKKRKSFFLFSTVGFTLVLLILSLIPPPKSLFDGLDTNILNYNISMGAWKYYSPEYIKSVDKFSPGYQSVPGLNLKRNVILLVVESLSSYQSKYFSGLPFDNLKEFDNSLKDASSLTFKYRCSSYNTSTNLFSLLTGYFPLLCPYGKMDFDNKKYYEHNLASEFNREGYHTVLFLPVRFVDSVDILSDNCPFETIINDEDPYFNSADRYVFNGVADDVALKRLVLLTQELKNNPKPYFVFMKTTTMHAPYLDPVTQTYSFEATVRFFDRVYKDFMKDLRDSGYFDRGGVLVVTGDHRAMVPMGSQEQIRYGVWAIQKVPLVFFGKNLKHVDDKNVYNHVDLHFSLQYLMLNRAWKNRFQKNMFAPEQNQSFTCAFFQQYFNFAEVLLDTSVGEGKILLNGDKTQIKCPNLSKEQIKLIESYLVWARTK